MLRAYYFNPFHFFPIFQLRGCDGKSEARQSKSNLVGSQKVGPELVQSERKYAPIILRQTKYSPTETKFATRMAPLTATARKAKLRSFIDIVPPAPIAIPNLPRNEAVFLDSILESLFTLVLNSFTLFNSL